MIINYADTVIVNTDTDKKQIMNRYHQRKNIFCVRNSFEEEDFKDHQNERFRRFTISHVGSIYGLRKVDVILKAISRLHNDGLIEPSSFRLLFVGLNDGRLIEDVKSSSASQYVEIKDMVPHKDALRIMARSHLLLLIKEFGPNSIGQIPGKLFEYLGSRNKILCIAPRNCEAAEIIKKTKAGYVIENDLTQLSDILLSEYGRYKDFQKGPTLIGRAAISDYTSSTMGQRLLEIIEE
jgi:glycosyltransferase involved in cell wall biosynthesis